jgi:NADPH2:quinone reductase
VTDRSDVAANAAVLAVVRSDGTVTVDQLAAPPQADTVSDPVPVALVAADVMPKDRQTARGEGRIPLPARFVLGANAVARRDDGSLVFVRGSIGNVGGLHDGVHASRFVADAGWLVPMPDGLDPVVAAAGVAVLADALYALDDLAQVQPGEVVLVLGSSSGVGAAAVDVALARGATVLAATRDPAGFTGREGVRAVGYDDLPTQVRSLTDGHGADVVIDNVGGALTSLGLRSTAWRGRHVLLGYLAGRDLAISSGDVIVTEARLMGMNIGHQTPARARELVGEALDLLVSGAHRPVVVATVSLSDPADPAAAAAELVTDRPGGRTVLLP